MGIEAVFTGLFELLVWLVVVGTGFTLLSFAALRRLGGRALLALWLISTLILGAWVGRWAATAFFDSPAHLWAFYLTPLLFFAVQLGFVAVALKQTHKRGMRPVVQFLLGLLVFAVAAIPAALLALVPSAILALLRSDTLVSTAAVTILRGENTGSGAAC